MSNYNEEQAEAIRIVREGLGGFSATAVNALRHKIQRYLEFRADVDAFYEAYFSQTCAEKCFESGQSMCCGHEGITTFFADVVVNALVSEDGELDALVRVLGEQDPISARCVYLGKQGCVWRVTPIVCAMFLCKFAKDRVFQNNSKVQQIWRDLKKEKQGYTWPDRPVLFEYLEHVFIRKGYHSDLMYFHYSPGLLHVKAQRNKRNNRCEKGA